MLQRGIHACYGARADEGVVVLAGDATRNFFQTASPGRMCGISGRRPSSRGVLRTDQSVAACVAGSWTGSPSLRDPNDASLLAPERDPWPRDDAVQEKARGELQLMVGTCSSFGCRQPPDDDPAAWAEAGMQKESAMDGGVPLLVISAMTRQRAAPEIRRARSTTRARGRRRGVPRGYLRSSCRWPDDNR